MTACHVFIPDPMEGTPLGRHRGTIIGSGSRSDMEGSVAGGKWSRCADTSPHGTCWMVRTRQQGPDRSLVGGGIVLFIGGCEQAVLEGRKMQDTTTCLLELREQRTDIEGKELLKGITDRELGETGSLAGPPDLVPEKASTWLLVRETRESAASEM